MVAEEMGEQVPEVEVNNAEYGGSGGGGLLDLIKSPTGEGKIEDYIDQPLNFDRSKGMAQILRGLTGLLGSLNYAVIDILLGALTWTKEKRGVAGA